MPTRPVLHITSSLDQRSGGPLRAILDLSAQSLALGVPNEVLGFGPVAIPDNPLPPQHIHTLPLRHAAYCYSPELRPWLREHLHRFSGVVLHGMWLYPYWAAAQECRRQQVPYACFPHGMLEPWPVWGQGWRKAAKKLLYWHWREKHIFQHARRIFHTTPRELDRSGSTFRLRTEQQIVVPYGILHECTPVHTPRQNSLMLQPGRHRALFLGRVHPKKNVEFLIRCWHAAQMPPDWELVIAGPASEPYRRTLESLIRTLSLHHSVRLTGAVAGEDKSYLLQSAQWFVLPSQQENFGIAVLEAIHHGCPVAVSNEVYLADYFPDQSAVLPLSAAAWTQFFAGPLRDAAYRDALLASYQQHVRPRFDFDHVCREWVATCRQTFTTAVAHAG